MFWDDIRALPQISLNCAWIRHVLEEALSDEGHFDEIWTNPRIEALTKDVEDKIRYKMNMGENVRIIDVLLSEYQSFLPRYIMEHA